MGHDGDTEPARELPRRAAAGLVAGLLVTLVATSCSPEDSGPTKRIEKSAQTDLAPLRARTVGLPEDATCLWFSGTLGDGAPGPSTYWIDASVSTTDEAVEEFRALCPDTAPSDPVVVAELAEELGEDEFAECPAAAESIAAEGWQTRAWISRTSPTLVITLVGQG